MNGTGIDWHEILTEPFVALELGARGEGKTALGHRLLEVFGTNGRDAYIMGFPDHKADLLPDYIDPLNPETTMDQWPEDSIVLIHEAHHLLHARRSMDTKNLEIDFLITVSRHKNSDIIYDTQMSHRLDKNAVAAVDAILVRWPALMQEDFERRQVRPIISDARDALSKYVDVHDDDDFTFVDRREDDDNVDLLKKHVYVHADQFRGEYPHEVVLPDHWSEDISKAYGGMDESQPRDSKTLDAIRADMATPDEVGEKDVSEVEQAIEAAGGDADAGGGGAAGQQQSAEVDSEAGREFIERMLDSDNRVFSNSYGQPIIEYVFPTDMTQEMEALFEEWDLNPSGASVYPQDPSFAEDRPEVGEALTALQVVLDDPEDRNTAGYDLDQIESELEDEPVLATRSNVVRVNVLGE